MLLKPSINLNGRTRLGIVVALTLLCAVVGNLVSTYLLSTLLWIEMLFPKPGLSGVALLALSPIGFLLAASLVRWVVDGFHESRSS
jgi:hypothetical protein